MSVTAVRGDCTTQAIAERVREAVARGAPLRIVGRGRWLDAGRPVDAADTLALDALTGIVAYTPGDLTLTARAGTPLDEIARITAAERQWLALDPMGARDGTLGATIATASAGPLRTAFGTPRDNVLGLEAVTGTGDIVHTGGRVVKNVAGFDLTRLFTGAWGTLAVITTATVRLRGIPEVDATVGLALPAGDAALETVLATLRDAPLAPWALEMVSPALAQRLGLTDGAVLLARLGGNTEDVRAQRAVIAACGDLVELPAALWRELRESEPPHAATVRLSARPTQLVALWRAALDAAGSDALVHATPAHGLVRAIAPLDEARVPGWFATLRRTPGAWIAERLPAALWRDVPSAVADERSRALARSFDPAGILNPGILGARA